MIYPRKITSEIQKYVSDPDIIVLTGMRRVGKTTLFQTIFDSLDTKNKIFLDIENPIVQKTFEETNYDNILSNLKQYGLDPNRKAYIFLDEIQAMPQLSQIIKYLFDHYRFKFFLTGSSSYYLKNLFPESLAGRKFVFELKPLDFAEFLVFKQQSRQSFPEFANKDQRKNFIRFEKLKTFFQEYLKYGGFPQVVLEPDEDKKTKRLQEIFKSYFEKDVQNLAKFKEIKVFRDLILLLMSRVGSKIDISRLSAELGTTRETVYSYLSFLESTFFLYLTPPFTNSADKLVSKAKKIYFCDTGLLNAHSQLAAGQILENSVFNCLNSYGTIKYYQKNSGREIDFILNDQIALEVKNKGLPSDQNQLHSLSTKLKLSESHVITGEFVNLPGFISVVDL